MIDRAGFAAIASFALCLLGAASSARADGASYMHMVRDGETLASIAQRYYGDPRRESVLVAENGLTTQGGAPIVVGLRLDIPVVLYHRARAGETWTQLAERFYGDSRRTSVILEANGATPGAQPDEGAELVIPYPLRHVAGQHETLSELAEIYYGDRAKVQILRRFNFTRGNRLQRGQIVLVPLADLVLSPEGRRVVEERTGAPASGGDVRAIQARIDSELPGLREMVRTGSYTEAVALANRLLGAAELTGNQIVTIQRELATAYVALDRNDLAEAAFRAALERQPDLELDMSRTSPRVRAALDAARSARAAAPPAPAVPAPSLAPTAAAPATPR